MDHTSSSTNGSQRAPLIDSTRIDFENATEIDAILEFRNLSCVVHQPNGISKLVLNNVTGIALPGQLTAILGPSGAGKTTFLDIIGGRKNTGDVFGEVLISGIPLSQLRNFKRISGYVLQDDKMIGTLSVREHLIYTASLRLPTSMPHAQKLQRVDAVLEELGISHIADSMIGTELTRGISGGERRRLSIATELVTDPAIIYLDEPTSGLDSYNAHSLMETLKKLARDKNRTIIMSIHQPRSNIYQLFDNVLLLSHGEMVYYGPVNDVLNHFSALGHECPSDYNPADFLIDLVTMRSKGVVQELAQRYKESEVFVDTEKTIEKHREQHAHLGEETYLGKHTHLREEYASTWLAQCWVLSKRTLINNLRNPYLMRMQYAMTIVLALLLGGMYWHLRPDLAGVQDRAGCMFFLISLLAFASMSSIDTFYNERGIFLRERANGMYSTSAYFVSKTLCDIIPMRVIPPLLLGGISYYMVGLHPHPSKFFTFLEILVLVSMAAGSLCLAISCATPSLSVGNLVAILTLLFFMLFGGFLVNKQSMPVFVRWLKWLSFLNYGFEVLMVNELDGLSVLFNPHGYNIQPRVVDGHVFLAQFDMQSSRFTMDQGVLVACSAVYLIIAYLFLRFVVKEKR